MRNNDWLDGFMFGILVGAILLGFVVVLAGVA